MIISFWVGMFIIVVCDVIISTVLILMAQHSGVKPRYGDIMQITLLVWLIMGSILRYAAGGTYVTTTLAALLFIGYNCLRLTSMINAVSVRTSHMDVKAIHRLENSACMVLIISGCFLLISAIVAFMDGHVPYVVLFLAAGALSEGAHCLVHPSYRTWFNLRHFNILFDNRIR